MEKLRNALTINVFRVYYLVLIAAIVFGAVTGNPWVYGVAAGLMVGDLIVYLVQRKKIDNHFRG